MLSTKAARLRSTIRQRQSRDTLRAPANVTVVVTNTVLSNNTFGVRATTAGTTGTIGITVTGTTVSGSSQTGFVADGTSAVRMMLSDVVSANNGLNGVQATGANTLVRIGNSVVTGNSGTGLIATSSGILQSYGNNQVNSNTTDGTPTTVALK